MQRRVAVWGTGNMGKTPSRSAVAFPGLSLTAAAAFAALDAPTGVAAATDIDATLAVCDSVAYMASGDTRPHAVNDIERCLRAGVHVVTPSLYSL